MDRKESLLKIFARKLREILARLDVDFERLQEIRLRVYRPFMIVWDNREWFVTESGTRTDRAEQAYQVLPEELRETMEYVGNYSLYAFEEEIRQGFITIQGGHRVGIAGKAVTDGRGVRTIKYISFMNVRLSHQIKGCAGRVMPYLYDRGQVLHTLLISPPRCGKTTLLRDIIRQLSDGLNISGCGYCNDFRIGTAVDRTEKNVLDTMEERMAGMAGRETLQTGTAVDRPAGVTVGVVDERSEIGACYQGIPQNDLGLRTDVLDCCPKARGMMMMIRTMSPEVIAVDEIGGREDLDAMEYVISCGCKLLATVHGNSIGDVARKPVLGRMVEDRMFERYIVLSRENGVGTIDRICDNNRTVLYREGRKRDVASVGGMRSGNDLLQRAGSL